ICWWLNSNIEDCFIVCAFPEEDVQTEAVEEVAAAPKAARRFCPDGWFSYQSKCYMFVNTPRSWFNAEVIHALLNLI
ncbi:unnamed protein product, partial [Oncorhynchus mykiss]